MRAFILCWKAPGSTSGEHRFCVSTQLQRSFLAARDPTSWDIRVLSCICTRRAAVAAGAPSSPLSRQAPTPCRGPRRPCPPPPAATRRRGATGRRRLGWRSAGSASRASAPAPFGCRRASAANPKSPNPLTRRSRERRCGHEWRAGGLARSRSHRCVAAVQTRQGCEEP